MALTKEDAAKLWEVYVRSGRNASALCKIVGKSPSRCRDLIREAKDLLGQELDLRDPEDLKRENAINQLIEEQNIPEDALSKGRVTNVVINKWGNDEQPNSQTKIYYKFDLADKVEWPPIRPHYKVKVETYKPIPKRTGSTTTRVFIWGDTQIGFWRDGVDLTPFHDEAAIDAGLQMLALYRPDRLVIIGDFLDFPELGKYRKEPAFAQTLNPAIAYATELLAKMRAIVGKDCIIDFIPGNHEARLTSAIVDNLCALYGLRRPGDNFSLLSIPYLLQFEALSIRCSEQYPSGQVWLADDIVCTHAPDKRLRATQICGHLVRATVDSDTFHYRDGAKTYKTFIVPGFGNYGGKPADKFRLNRTNIPSNVARSNAEQACATVEIAEDGMRHKVTVWEIQDGFAFFKDTEIQGVAKPWEYTEAA